MIKNGYTHECSLAIGESAKYSRAASYPAQRGAHASAQAPGRSHSCIRAVFVVGNAPLTIANTILQWPGGAGAVSATASQAESGLTVIVINRHTDAPASVRLAVSGGFVPGNGRLLAAESPEASNSAAELDLVAPAPLGSSRGADLWRVELPARSLATIVFQRG